MEQDLKRLPDESQDQYFYRICNMKDTLGFTWPQMAEIFNSEFGCEKGDTAYRKEWAAFQRIFNANVDKLVGDTTYLDELKDLKHELEKEKIKVRDERLDYQKSIREASRRESFLELVERSMSKTVKPFDYKPSPVIDSNEDMIVCLSDLHAGIEVQNWWNKYDVDVLRNRLEKYLNEIASIQELHRCKVCNVVLSGDNISGLIHSNLRLQNNENVIEQLKIAITYIGEFIYILHGWFEEVHIYSVSGNHSRLNPNKDEHLKGEELDEMIPFCLKIQFANNNKITVHDEYMIKVDDSIVAFRTRGNKLFYVVHGDKDTPANVVQNLTLMSGVKPDGIIMGHRHHNGFDTEHNVKVIQCGCVVGMDDYCVDKRISGEPEQCVVITSDKRTVKCIYDVGLN